MSRQRALAVAAFITLGLVWGVNFVFMRAAALYITAGQTTLLRLLFGVVPILLFAAATRALSWQQLRYLPHFIVQAFLAAGFYYYAYAVGIYRLDSGVAGALSGSIPLFASIAAIVLFRTERFSPRKALGVGLGALGVVLIARPWDAGGVDPSGVAWMLAGSASLGLSFGYARRFITPLGIPAAAAATYQMLIATIALAFLTDWEGITNLTQSPAALAIVVVGLGIVGTGVAFVLYYVAVDGLGAVTASTATYIPPVVSPIIGAIFVAEPLHPLTLVGVALILTAATIMQLPWSRTKVGQAGASPG